MRRAAWVLLALMVALWPLTFRYSSVGIDVERGAGGTVAQEFYRLRWPGNGSLLVGRIDEHRDASSGPVQRFDLGADVLRPARPIRARSEANRLGFWWIHADARRGDARSDAAPHADRVWLLGAPHWLLVAAAAVLVVVAELRRPRPRRAGR